MISLVQGRMKSSVDVISPRGGVDDLNYGFLFVSSQKRSSDFTLSSKVNVWKPFLWNILSHFLRICVKSFPQFSRKFFYFPKPDFSARFDGVQVIVSNTINSSPSRRKYCFLFFHDWTGPVSFQAQALIEVLNFASPLILDEERFSSWNKSRRAFCHRSIFTSVVFSYRSMLARYLKRVPVEQFQWEHVWYSPRNFLTFRN